MHLDGDQAHNQPPIGRRVTVKEAADVLGISPEAVRARIKRGTLYKEKGADGTVYVRLGDDGTDDGTSGHQGRDELVEELRDRIRYLEEESRRKDHLLAAALERISPALEAPSETREAPEPVSDAQSKSDVAEEDKRPWWRRLLQPS
jgi:hypothetical protein